MKILKLSLVALICTTSIYAIENAKIDGFVKLWYQTGESSAANSNTIFTKDASVGNLVAKVRGTGDFNSKLSYGWTLYGSSTMGLQNSIVSGSALTPSVVTDGEDRIPVWIGEAYISYKEANSNLRLGRLEIDTPLVYGEVCACGPLTNTFEAVVLTNTDIPDTTVVATFISKSNGQGDVVEEDGKPSTGLLNGPTNGGVNGFGDFRNFHGAIDANNTHDGGAYAVGVINNTISNTTLSAFGYMINDTATAVWVDAAYEMPESFKVQAMYANMTAIDATEKYLKNNSVATGMSTDAIAMKVTASINSGLKIFVAGSKVSDGFLPIANAANNFATSKIFTAGHIGGTFSSRIAGAAGTTAYSTGLRGEISDIRYGATYHSFDFSKNINGGGAAGYFGVAAGPMLDASLKPKTVELYAATKLIGVNFMAAYLAEIESAFENNEKIDNHTFRLVGRLDF